MTTTAEINDLAIRVATEFKTIRNQSFGSPTGSAAGLNTTSKNLVGAVNEVFAGMGSAAIWGGITGTLSSQSDLNTALSNKADLVGGFVPSGQLPSFVDDVLEYANFASLPGTGASGKIYVTLNDNLTFRWSGSAYVEISASLALGETSATAYRGDRGKTAYDHSQLGGNPHGTTMSDISGLVAAINAKFTTAAGTTAGPGILELATDAETQTGTATDLAITPGNLSARTATTTRTGIVETATDAEAITGTDTSRYITPGNLRAVLGDQTTDFVATFEAALV